MRYLFVLLLLTSSCAVFSQSSDPHPAKQYVRRLLKEKIRLKDLPAAIEWYKQHPELIGQSELLPENTSAAGRSAEIVVHDDSKAESEVHAAINPTDTNNIIAAAILQDVNSASSPIKVPVYYTKDFGQSWLSSNITFSPNPGDGFVAGGGDPVLAFDKTGKAYISWLVLTLDLFGGELKLALYYASSANQGQTWSMPALIDFGNVSLDVLTGGNGSGALVDKQWMAADQSSSIYEGNLYTSYTRFDIIDSSNITMRILVKTKSKNNDNFGPAVEAHAADYEFVQYSSIDVDDQGNVHVLFFAGNAGETPSLYHALSTNGGASFQPEVKISAVNYPASDESPSNSIDGLSPERLYPCPHLQAGTTPGTVYATWSADGLQQQETEGYDIWFAKSTDNGQTWQTPARVNPGDNPLAEQYYPALAVNDNGTICISYYDRTNDPEGTETHYVVAFSSDGGVTFTPPVNASLVPSDFSEIGALNDGFGIGEYTQIVCTKYNAIPVWADGRSNNGDIDIYAAILPISDQASGASETGTVTDAFSVEAPNPSRDNIDLTIKLEKPSRLAIQIFSSDGKMVFSENTGERQNAGIYNRQIPLPQGIYICRVETESGFKARRIVVE